MVHWDRKKEINVYWCIMYAGRGCGRRLWKRMSNAVIYPLITRQCNTWWLHCNEHFHGMCTPSTCATALLLIVLDSVCSHRYWLWRYWVHLSVLKSYLSLLLRRNYCNLKSARFNKATKSEMIPHLKWYCLYNNPLRKRSSTSNTLQLVCTMLLLHVCLMLHGSDHNHLWTVSSRTQLHIHFLPASYTIVILSHRQKSLSASRLK